MNLSFLRTLIPVSAGIAITAALTCAWAKSFDPTAGCVGNERVIYLSMMQYAEDNNERLPPITLSNQFAADLEPYARNPKTFLCPETGRTCVPNPALKNFCISQSTHLKAGGNSK